MIASRRESDRVLEVLHGASAPLTEAELHARLGWSPAVLTRALRFLGDEGDIDYGTRLEQGRSVRVWEPTRP